MTEPGRLDDLPGYRRSFIITPEQDRVTAMLEDDLHCMSVTVHHDGAMATGIDATMYREPWTTCPGAIAVVQRTFMNVPLSDFPARGGKSANCTHLHDLALLAAAHAGDTRPLLYEILVADPIDGVRRTELRRDGAMLLRWADRGGRLFEPPELAGTTLIDLRDWIAGLSPQDQEAARLLRWGMMVAHGRTLPMEEQSDVSKMRMGSCYTFQPQNVGTARRIGEIRDFSAGSARPFDRLQRVTPDSGGAGPL